MTGAGTPAERLFAVIDGQRWDEYETVMHPDVEMTSPSSTLHSAREWAEFSRGFAAAMSDGQHTPAWTIQDGDAFAVEGVWTGTHTGPLAGPGGEIPATGRSVTLPFCAVGTLRDGRSPPWPSTSTSWRCSASSASSRPPSRPASRRRPPADPPGREEGDRP